ncbi:Ankyrin repeat domain-containing protein 44 [Chamberlinius hualienensis]
MDRNEMDQTSDGFGLGSIKTSLEEAEELHNYIVNGQIENVKTFFNSSISRKPQPYLNRNGQSAAFVALQNKQFDIYSTLISNDIRLLNENERIIVRKLNRSETSRLDKSLHTNFCEINNAAVYFLLSHTKVVCNKNINKRIDIERYYNQLNEIPEIGLIFSVIKCCGFVDIICDFEKDSIIDIDITATEKIKGKYDLEKGRIYIAAKRKDETYLKGTIAHELTHYAMAMVFANSCKPYHFNDRIKEKEFHEIIDKTEDCKIKIDDIIKSVFQYRDSQRPAELIVRVNHIFAFYGFYIGEQLLNIQAHKLLLYYRDHVMLQCKIFIQDKYLFKTKSEIEIFNLSSGLVTKIQDTDIVFQKTFRLELEKFVKYEDQPFLVISTSYPSLTANKLYQALCLLDLTLSQYLFIDSEIYLNQFKEIDRLVRYQSCQLLILNMSEDKENELKKLLQTLSKQINTKINFKTVFIIYKAQVDIFKKQLNMHDFRLEIDEDDNLSFINLTKDAQNNILLKEVEFQGELIPLKKLLNKNSKYLIDAAILIKLISNEKIKIASTLNFENFNQETYISRELKYSINESMAGRSNMFTDISFNDMSINRLSLNTPTHQILNENDLIQLVSNEKVVVIADSAGSGKSTLLTHIAILIKQQFNDLWILRINLINFTSIFMQKLETNNEFTSIEAVQFLIESSKLFWNDFEHLNFVRNIFECNISKSVVMFDGFDEINPDYDEIVKNLIKVLLNVGIKQMCVNFGNESLELKTFTKHLLESINNFFSIKKSFMENPLTLMMFAEAYQSQCKDYLQSQKNNYQFVKKIDNILKIDELYEKFIKAKFEFYQKEKLKLDISNPRIKADVLKKFKKFVELHQIVALKFYFSSSEVDVLLAVSHIKVQDIDTNAIGAYGIVKNCSNIHPEFDHLTFADYFVATFLVKNVLQQKITLEIAEILKTVLLKNNFKIVRSFLNECLSDETITSLYKMEEFLFIIEKCNFDEQNSLLSIPLEESNDKIVQLMCSCLVNTKFKLMSDQPKIGNMLFLAVRNSNKTLIKILMDNYNADICVTDDRSFTPLHVASAFSTKEIIELLIKQYDAYIDVIDNVGLTPLHLASAYNSVEVIKTLIENDGVNIINTTDNTGRNALHWASAYNSKEVAKMLVKDYGSSVNAVDNAGKTPLHWAAISNCKDVIKMLINDHGASVNVSDSKGRIPLHWASGYNSKEVAKMLVKDYGSSVNAVDNAGKTPLHWAATSNCKEMIKTLIDDHGANVNATDNKGRIPLHWASACNNKEIIKMLIDDYGSSVNAVDNAGKTPLHWAATSNCKEVIKMLIDDYGVSVNIEDHKQSIPLHWAAAYNCKEAIKLLIENYGSSVNAVDTGGNTPLHVAVEKNTKHVIKMLIDDCGANVNSVDFHGCTPLHVAAMSSGKEVIKMLIEDYGANVNAVTNFGSTSLHLAAANNSKEIIKMLTEDYGSSVNVVTNHGSTPLHLATAYNDKDIVRMLIEDYGSSVNVEDNNRSTPLHLAVAFNRKEGIRVVLQSELMVLQSDLVVFQSEFMVSCGSLNCDKSCDIPL